MAHGRPDWTDWVQIAGSDITLDVSIQAAAVTVPMSIQSQAVTLSVDISAQSVGNISVDIAAQTLAQLNMNIAASAVTIDVAIQSSAVTLNVQTAAGQHVDIDISAQSIGHINIDIAEQSVGNLNINIAASAVTITVSVTGTAQIDIETQSVGIYLQPDWQALQGTDKNFYFSGINYTWNDGGYVSYTVPAGKTLYLCGVSFAIMAAAAADYDHFLYCMGSVINYTTGVFLAYSGFLAGGQLTFTKPLVFSAGQEVRISNYNYSNITCHLTCSGWGYEI